MQISSTVAVITGGASGLGEAAARRLIELGATVAAFDRDDAKGAALAAELGDAPTTRSMSVTSRRSKRLLRRSRLSTVPSAWPSTLRPWPRPRSC